MNATRYGLLALVALLATLSQGAGFENTRRVPGNRALLEVRVPFGAELLVDGGPTHQVGPLRTFITPPLRGGPNRGFHYTLKATWLEKGHVKTVERVVHFKPGARVCVDLLEPESPPEAIPFPPKTKAKTDDAEVNESLRPLARSVEWGLVPIVVEGQVKSVERADLQGKPLSGGPRLFVGLEVSRVHKGQGAQPRQQLTAQGWATGEQRQDYIPDVGANVAAFLTPAAEKGRYDLLSKKGLRKR